MTLAFVFPGQGSQRCGMLDALPQPDSVCRLLDAAEALSGVDLRAVSAFGTPAELADTLAAQPLLYLVDWAWGMEAIASGLRPAAVAGHSLGELAALAVAGVFSVEAGLELVVARSRIMARQAVSSPGAMSAVLGMDAVGLRSAIAGIPGVWIANDNAAGQVVVSGTVVGVAAASEAIVAAGARRIVSLQVSGAFHSPIMAPAAEEFAALLEATEFKEAAYPVIQNTDPTPSTDPATIRERLTTQIAEPVRWTETMGTLVSMGVTDLLECGPGAVLAGLAKRVDGLTAFTAEADGIPTLVERGGK